MAVTIGSLCAALSRLQVPLHIRDDPQQTLKHNWEPTAVTMLVNDQWQYLVILVLVARDDVGILAEGAIALSVTLSGGALFAS